MTDILQSLPANLLNHPRVIASFTALELAVAQGCQFSPMPLITDDLRQLSPAIMLRDKVVRLNQQMLEYASSHLLDARDWLGIDWHEEGHLRYPQGEQQHVLRAELLQMEKRLADYWPRQMDANDKDALLGSILEALRANRGSDAYQLALAGTCRFLSHTEQRSLNSTLYDLYKALKNYEKLAWESEFFADAVAVMQSPEPDRFAPALVSVCALIEEVRREHGFQPQAGYISVRHHTHPPLDDRIEQINLRLAGKHRALPEEAALMEMKRSSSLGR